MPAVIECCRQNASAVRNWLLEYPRCDAHWWLRRADRGLHWRVVARHGQRDCLHFRWKNAMARTTSSGIGLYPVADAAVQLRVLRADHRHRPCRRCEEHVCAGVDVVPGHRGVVDLSPARRRRRPARVELGRIALAVDRLSGAAGLRHGGVRDHLEHGAGWIRQSRVLRQSRAVAGLERRTGVGQHVGVLRAVRHGRHGAQHGQCAGRGDRLARLPHAGAGGQVRLYRRLAADRRDLGQPGTCRSCCSPTTTRGRRGGSRCRASSCR